MNANRISAVIGLFLACGASAQQSLESTYRMTGSAVVAAFEGPRAVLQKSSAVILDGRKEAVYGTVVSADGHILTKASEFSEVEKPAVTVDRTRYDNVEVLATDETWDVVLLKIDASGLQPIVHAPTSAVPQGTWVVANGATTRATRRALVGIVSANIREIPAAGGAALGVVLKQDTKKLEIEEVNEKSGAREAGLQKDDVILEVEGKVVNTITALAEVLKDRKAGTTVKLTYRRAGEKHVVDVRLMAKGELFSEMANRNDMMSGDFSRRRSGFPRVLQHDILGNSTVTGGPVLDLDGRCLGMNIARANRAESFAIPVEDLKEITDRLMAKAAGKP